MPWRFCGCEGHPGIGCCNPNCRKTLSGWCHSTTWKQISGTTANQATLPTTQIGGNAAITVGVYGSQTNCIQQHTCQFSVKHSILTFHLTNTSLLHNVAYIPKFKFNLILVSALLTNPYLSISFSQNAFDNMKSKFAIKSVLEI